MRRLSFILALLPAALGLRAADCTLTVSIRHGQMPLADAVVSLTALDAPPAPPAAAPEVVVAQEDKEYDPYVTPVLAGTRVAFPNRDNVQHHLYSLSKAKRFEKPLYASGTSESVLFDLPGVVVLGCNIHDWMIAYVVVLPTPWFAKTGAGGEALLTGMPAGRYRLEVWHPRLAKAVAREVTLSAGANSPASFALELKPDRRIRRAPENRSGGY